MSESSIKHKAESPKKLNFAVFICSTSRYRKIQKNTQIDDASGNLIEALVKAAGHNMKLRRIISDNKVQVQEAVKDVLSSLDLDVAIFCGGTGIAPSDVTIESVSPFLKKTLPGFGEIFRHLSYERIGSAAILSRAIAGVAEGKAFFCIPGSPEAVRFSVETLILPEAPHIVRHAR